MNNDIAKGVIYTSGIVGSTLGPGGRTVILEKEFETIATKDGVSVAKHLASLADATNDSQSFGSAYRIGVKLAAQAANSTVAMAGDGTTTSTVIMGSIVNQANGFDDQEQFVNIIDLCKGINAAKDAIVDNLEKMSVDIAGNEELIHNISLISANNDEHIGKLVSDAFCLVGGNGLVEMVYTEDYIDSVEFSDGLVLKSGLLSPSFMNTNKNECVLNGEVAIALFDKKVEKFEEVLDFLKSCSTKKNPLLVIAPDFSNEVIATIIKNHAKFNVVALKSPGVGDSQKDFVRDLRVVLKDSKEIGGCKSAKKVVIDRDKCVISGDFDNESQEFTERVIELSERLAYCQNGPEKKTLKSRLSLFDGGVATIKLGAYTPVELKEKGDRVEDAIKAVQSALEEGVVPGGGAAFVIASKFKCENTCGIWFDKGVEIVRNAIFEPSYKILENLGIEESKINEIVNTILNDGNITFDGVKMDFVKTEDLQIVDPTKVSKNALINAISTAVAIINSQFYLTFR